MNFALAFEALNRDVLSEVHPYILGQNELHSLNQFRHSFAGRGVKEHGFD
jgi:hypothetical protein